MPTNWRCLRLLGTTALLVASASGSRVVPGGPVGAVLRPPGPPVAFIENAGQWAEPALFCAKVNGATVRIESGGVAIALRDGPPGQARRGVVLRLALPITVQDSVRVEGVELLPGAYSFLLGNDPSLWGTRVRAYRGVAFRGLRPGVDLLVGADGGALQLDLLMEDGAEAGDFVLDVDGAKKVSSSSDGSLILETELCTWIQRPPRILRRKSDGTLAALPARVAALGSASFALAPADPPADAAELASGLAWSTLLGGSSSGETAWAVAVGPSGEVVVGGDTGSFDFPVTPGAFDSTYSPGFFGVDCFVSKFDANGSILLMSSYLGGDSTDFLEAVGVTSTGEPIAVGTTFSTDYPLTASALDMTGNIFVSRLGADGASLQFSTKFGGSSLDQVLDAVISPSGIVTLCGATNSVDFPTTPGAYDTVNQGATLYSDAIAVRIDTTQPELLASTLLGGSTVEFAHAVAVDSDDRVVLVGQPLSADAPVTTDLGPGFFVARLSPDLTSLDYLTRVGTNASARPIDVATDLTGAITVVGSTDLPALPLTPGAYDTTFDGLTDGIILRLDPGGTFVQWASYLGSFHVDVARAVAVDGAGSVYVGGHTRSAAFPTTAGCFAPAKASPGSGIDDFVARLSPDGSELWYSTFLGGSSDESSDGYSRYALALDGTGGVVVASQTSSPDFPTTVGAYDPSWNGSYDAYVSSLTLLPLGVLRLGLPTSSCSTAPVAGVTAMAQVGRADFGLTCTDAPASTDQGILVVGAAGLAAPLAAKGAGLWVSPSPVLLLVPVASNDLGFCDLPAAVPPDASLAGLQAYVQFFWPNACAPPALVASGALAITIQP